jgi:hypothetical protein
MLNQVVPRKLSAVNEEERAGEEEEDDDSDADAMLL